MKKIIGFFLIFTLFSCSDKAIEKPDNLIDEAKMENILYDLALLQAIKGNDAKLLPKNNIDPKKYIYQKYKIDSLQFVNSNKYYSADIENYKSLYERVLERVKNNRLKAEKILKKESDAKLKKIKDSVSKARKNSKTLTTG
ncbi:DUF4296 domain-containing protein [Flavobacterium sp. H122]|uniref:DUF4296 domain-containing protein n=1 Tax=Flavobacterium sp. H122 TaxID=2529860 RepID=UPI0010A9A29C|nr:DUF4296 domain-containing protein [Flavobacterium sp. H122]